MHRMRAQALVTVGSIMVRSRTCAETQPHLLIDEQDSMLGKQLKLTAVDPASDQSLFAEKTSELLE